MSWEVRISSPLVSGTSSELARFVDEQILSGTFSTDIQCGFNTLTLSVPRGLGDAVPPGAHVEVYCDGTLVWEGQRRRPTFVGYDMARLEAAGYGVTLVDADIMQTAALAVANNPTAEQQYPAHSILLRALALAPLLSQGPTWAQPVLYQPLSIYDGKTLDEVAKQLNAACGTNFAVWEGRKASWGFQQPPRSDTFETPYGGGDYGAGWFPPGHVPEAPDFQHSIEDCPSWEADDLGVWTRVTVEYTDAYTKQKTLLGPFVNTSAEKELSISRHKRLSGGTITQSFATMLASNWLANYAAAPVRATLGPLANFKDGMGGGVPFHQVRATQWAQIGGVTEGRPIQVIVSTSTDMKQHMTTAQLGAPLFDSIGRVVELQRVAGAVKAGVSPNTYATAS